MSKSSITQYMRVCTQQITREMSGRSGLEVRHRAARRKRVELTGPEYGCSHTESSFARSWQAGFGKHGSNALESKTLRAGAGAGRIPALSVWIPMYYRVYQTLPASQPASFSQNCSQCVSTLQKTFCYTEDMPVVSPRVDGLADFWWRWLARER